jgi:hypothetical protein
MNNTHTYTLNHIINTIKYSDYYNHQSQIHTHACIHASTQSRTQSHTLSYSLHIYPSHVFYKHESTRSRKSQINNHLMQQHQTQSQIKKTNNIYKYTYLTEHTQAFHNNTQIQTCIFSANVYGALSRQDQFHTYTQIQSSNHSINPQHHNHNSISTYTKSIHSTYARKQTNKQTNKHTLTHSITIQNKHIKTTMHKHHTLQHT